MSFVTKGLPAKTIAATGRCRLQPAPAVILGRKPGAKDFWMMKNKRFNVPKTINYHGGKYADL